MYHEIAVLLWTPMLPLSTIVYLILDSLAGWFMEFNATYNNISVISWLSVLLVEEARIPGKTTDKLYDIIILEIFRHYGI